MAQHLDAQLIVSHLTVNIVVARRNEVIKLVNATLRSQGQNALLRQQVVEFELTKLYVEPGTVADIVKPRHNGFEMKRGGRIRGWEHVEREVLLQCAAGVEIETAEVEAGRRELGFGGATSPDYVTAAVILIDLDAVGANAMPDRSDAERDWPVSRILPDWGIAIVHQVVAVIFDFLAKVIEHGPAFMVG